MASGIDANGRIIGTAWSNGGLAEEQSASERAIVLVPVR